MDQGKVNKIVEMDIYRESKPKLNSIPFLRYISIMLKSRKTRYGKLEKEILTN